MAVRQPGRSDESRSLSVTWAGSMTTTRKRASRRYRRRLRANRRHADKGPDNLPSEFSTVQPPRTCHQSRGMMQTLPAIICADIAARKVLRSNRRCHNLHSNYMLNRGYAYTTIIRAVPWTNPALPLGKPLPPLNPTSLATKTEQRRSHPQRRHRHRKRSVTLGQTLVWNRPPWIEPDSPQHFEVLFEDPHLLAVNKPSGLPHPPWRRLHGKHPPAPGAKANPQGKPCPPVGPSHHRHSPLRQNIAGGL